MTDRLDELVPPASAVEEVLSAAPNLTRTLVSGAAGPLLPGNPGNDGANVIYRLDGVQADTERMIAYERLVGLQVTDWLPTGFVHVLTFPIAAALMARRDFPLPMAGLVHLSNRVDHYRAIGVDEELTVRAWAQEFRGHRRGTIVDLVTEVRGADDEVAWMGTSAYLSRSVPWTGDEPAAAAHPEWDASEVVPTARWQLDAGVGRRYAAISGDRNPIHLSALTAKPLGFKRAIAHGMYTASRALASSWPLPDAPFTWQVTFDKPVFLPGAVSLHVDREEDGATRHVLWSARTTRRHLYGSVTPLA